MASVVLVTNGSTIPLTEAERLMVTAEQRASSAEPHAEIVRAQATGRVRLSETSAAAEVTLAETVAELVPETVAVRVVWDQAIVRRE